MDKGPVGYATLKRAVESRDVGSRSAIDSKFRRYLEGESEAARQDAEAWGKCKRNTEKTLFKLQWVDREWAKIKCTRSHGNSNPSRYTPSKPTLQIMEQYQQHRGTGN